jgi:hypothetical protein
MSELDRMIEAALRDEDREILARAGREPDYLGQVAGLFGGSLGWVNGVVMAAQAGLFFGGVWCAWMFFAATDVLAALHWGLPAAVLIVTAAILKVGALWPSMQANRLLREIKRLELQIARQSGTRAVD